MTQPDVTVVLPLFGTHFASQSLSAVTRAWLGQDVPCEVVVGVAGERPVPDALRCHDGGRFRFVVASPDTDHSSPLRNLAAAAARASLLYLSDADVAPVGTDFLSRALRWLREPGDVVLQPWMYRLVNADEVLDVGEFRRPGRGRVCHVYGDKAGNLTPVGEERFLWAAADLMVVDLPRDVQPDIAGVRTWRPHPFHWGGFLMHHELFDSVGGFCEAYTGWGSEDDDLIAKLDGRANLIRAWRVDRATTCVHFEHDRTHAGHATNQTILARRRTAGADQMIDEDLRGVARAGGG